jgi:hypothetical protein
MVKKSAQPVDDPGMSLPPDPADSLLTITKGDDSIVRVTWTPGATITEAVARRSVELVVDISEGRRLPLLVDMSQVKSMTRDGRSVYSDEKSMLALALVGDSPVVRVIANFALGLNKPGVPTKFFTSTDEAQTWLSGFPT